jgi:hypothetical protein
MTGTPRLSGEEFAIARLRENPALDYAALRRAGEAAGVDIQPIQYGRARRQLGLTGSIGATTEGSAARGANVGEREAEAGGDDTRDDTRDNLPAAQQSPAPSPLPKPPPPPQPAEAGSDDAPATTPKRRKGSPAFDFLLEHLRADGSLSYGELRTHAEAAGHKIAPIMYGRAKAILGLVPVRPRGARKKKDAAAAGARTPKTLKQVESVEADRFQKNLADVRNIDELLTAVKQLDAERLKLRRLLERIADCIDEALGYNESD